MRALLVGLVLLVSSTAGADQAKPRPTVMSVEAKLVKEFFEATHAAPDKAMTQLAKSVKQAIGLRPAACIKKVKAVVADDKHRKLLVKCLGEFAEFANFGKWESRTIDDIHPPGPKGFAKKLPKDTRLVMGGHSDGFVVVGLDASNAIIGIWIDLSASE